MKKNYMVIVLSVLLLSALLAFAGGQTEIQAAAGGEEVLSTEGDLTLVGWGFATDYAKSLLKDFEAAYNIPVEFFVLPSGAKYQEAVVQMFIAHDPIDVLYLNCYNSRAYIEAGWIKPLNVYAPQDEIDKLKSGLEESFLNAWTVNGNLYALPYYQDVWMLVYNTELFAEAGINVFPSTWEELKNACMKIKKQGSVKYPMALPLGQNVFLRNVVMSMVFSIGGRMFDDNFDPVFDRPNSAFRTVMNWFLDGLYDSEIIDPKSLEANDNDNWPYFAQGHSAVTMIPSYRMAPISDESTSDVVGKASLAIMPGTTHETISWSQGYVISAFTDAPDKAWNLMDFLGGDGKDGSFHARKGWMSNYALGSGYKESWDNIDVRESLSKIIGETNINIIKEQTKLSRHLPVNEIPWISSWIGDFEIEVCRVFTKEITLDEAIKNLISSWERNKKGFSG